MSDDEPRQPPRLAVLSDGTEVMVDPERTPQVIAQTMVVPPWSEGCERPRRITEPGQPPRELPGARAIDCTTPGCGHGLAVTPPVSPTTLYICANAYLGYCPLMFGREAPGAPERITA